MAWMGKQVPDPALGERYRAVDDLAEWSDWLPFATALAAAIP
jgi:hypothetical protein